MTVIFIFADGQIYHSQYKQNIQHKTHAFPAFWILFVIQKLSFVM